MEYHEPNLLTIVLTMVLALVIIGYFVFNVKSEPLISLKEPVNEVFVYDEYITTDKDLIPFKSIVDISREENSIVIYTETNIHRLNLDDESTKKVTENFINFIKTH